jgi:hypothetical protein
VAVWGLFVQAQDVAVAGRVVRDTTQRPVPRHWVILHAMTRGGGGPVDSMRTDAAGRYAFKVEKVDPEAVYVVSAQYAGIAHFSEPIVLAGRLTADFGALAVFDTTSGGPPIRVSLRYLNIGATRDDGTHDVLEAIELQNPGSRTRVPADSAAVWQGAIPPGVVQFQVGESDVSAEAVSLRGDTVMVFGPISPGGSKQLSFAYTAPATMRELRVPIDQPIAEVLLLVEDTTALVTAPGLERLAVQELEGHRYARYRLTAPALGADVTVALPLPRFRADRLVPWIVGVAALALLIGLVIALRKPKVSR